MDLFGPLCRDCWAAFHSLFFSPCPGGLKLPLLTGGPVGPAVTCSLWDKQHLLENLPGDMSQKVTAFSGHPAIKKLPCHAPRGGCPGMWTGSSICHRFSRSAPEGKVVALERQVRPRIHLPESPSREPYFTSLDALPGLSFSGQVCRTWGR